MEKSAVEWLINKLQNSPAFHSQFFKEEFEEAKKIFEQQIIDACNQKEFEDIDGMGIHETITKGEQYCNEKFVNF
jgi:hypothetical protein